ncbi:unnamed protein product [Mycena citricolor]|uniref:Uncharacterized protein n=1 Tax=Mycena citricolor TaxID=2018698 RepID=A0AAD2HI28_9AGAR|nr:unnamed protein product [Mycena citricolor]CAK5275210.1 unnamed protein product [Mycena citricolor]
MQGTGAPTPLLVKSLSSPSPDLSSTRSALSCPCPFTYIPHALQTITSSELSWEVLVLLVPQCGHRLVPLDDAASSNNPSRRLLASKSSAMRCCERWETYAAQALHSGTCVMECSCETSVDVPQRKHGCASSACGDGIICGNSSGIRGLSRGD